MITAEQVATEVKARNMSGWPLRRCSFCNCPIGYVFKGGLVGFDGSCDCTSARGIQLSSYGELAATFNRQTPEVSAAMWQAFLEGKEYE